jgi:hypothetical protein
MLDPLANSDFRMTETHASLIEVYGTEMAAMVLEEFRTGVNFNLVQAQKAHKQMSATPHTRSNGVDGLGYIACEIPADIYWNWENYQKGFWRDPSNREWFLRHNPEYRRKYQPKPRVGWVPLLAN